MTMTPLILELARIGLRYIGAALITKGIVAPDIGVQFFEDPAVAQIVAGVLASAVAEIGYAVAKLRAKP